MAYMDQERKAIIGAALKLATAGTGLKYSLSVQNHSCIVMTMKSGPIDFISDYNQVGARSKPATNYLYINKYFFQEHFTPGVQVVIRKIVDAMHSAGHYDRSDIQSDYFDHAYYIEIQVGAWDKPYILTK
jgi:hypothetical protein